MPNILEVNHLAKTFTKKSLFAKTREVKALTDVTFALKEGETLAVVGESGCGKSTLAKILMNIEQPTSGHVSICGKMPSELSSEEYRQIIQMIFQDPYGSLNPRKKAAQIIAEPLIIDGKLTRSEIEDQTAEVMHLVGLRPEFGGRYPHMFSGGQRQRIGIARALILEPKIIICDEPVSALDVSIQAQILNLLMDLQDKLGLSYIFISHDLSVVRHIADRVLVIQYGKVVELRQTSELFESPEHEYTRYLLSSAPQLLVH